jgi:hypothetical protein
MMDREQEAVRMKQIPAVIRLERDLTAERDLAEERVKELEAVSNNALQALASVSGRLRVEATNRDADMGWQRVKEDANLLAAMCPPLRAALSQQEPEG